MTSLKSLELIDGVGPDFAAKFHENGVGSVEELVAIRPGFARGLADRIDGISLRGLVERFRPQARFLVLPGVTTAMASRLVENGVRNYRDLILADAADLLGRFKELVVGLASEAEIAALQVACARALLFDRVLIFVSDKISGKSLADAKVVLRDPGHRSRSTSDVIQADAAGVIVVFGCAQGRSHTLHVDAPGYKRASISFVAQGGMIRLLRLGLTQGADQPSADEFAGQSLGVVPAGAFITTEWVEPADVPDGSCWRVHHADSAGKVTLNCLSRRRFNSEIRTYTLKLAKASLPAPPDVGAVFRFETAGGWRKATTAELASIAQRRGIPSEGENK